MMEDLKKVLLEAKKQDWKKSTVCFFVVKRRLVQRQGNYSVMEVEIDETFAKKLRNIAISILSKANEANSYDYNTADQDNNFLTIDISETDLHKILEEINSPKPITKAMEYQEIINSWIYIAKFEIDNLPPLYAVRKISESWNTKKVKSVANVIFQDNMLVDLKDEEIFRIDSLVDFFSYKEKIFIAHKKNFETAMNFREGMINNRDEIVEEMKVNKIFSDVNKLKELVGDNMKRLRKLSQVKKAGYYKDKIFLDSLKAVSKEENWGIKFSEDGTIDIDDNDIDTILTLLNNGRLTSKINGESFDADVKRKI